MLHQSTNVVMVLLDGDFSVFGQDQRIKSVVKEGSDINEHNFRAQKQYLTGNKDSQHMAHVT